MVSRNPPRKKLAIDTRGNTPSRSRRASRGVSRPLGKGRHGLFTESSRTEDGRRWFAMVSRSRFDQTQNTSRGRRDVTSRTVGVAFVVRRDPESALKTPKAICGNTTVFKSLRLKSHSVYGRKTMDRALDVTLASASAKLDFPQRSNSQYQMLLTYSGLFFGTHPCPCELFQYQGW